MLLISGGLVLFVLVSINSPVKSEVNKDESGEDLKFAVVIDCGSSGTRAHIYSWPAKASNEQELSNLSHHTDKTTGKKLIKLIEPGLSSVSNEPNRAGEYLKPIMDFVALNIPADKHSNSPIYIMATGGMRLLDKNLQDEILNVITQSFRRDYRFNKIDARVISGTEEGKNLWLTVNSLAGRLGSGYSGQQPASLYKQPASSRTLAILEMGGASSQIAFEVGAELNEHIRRLLAHNPEAYRTFDRSIVDVNLGQNRHTKLFSVSFLGLGANSARSLFIDMLIRQSAGIVKARNIGTKSAEQNRVRSGYNGRSLTCAPMDSLRINDPCLPRASTETVKKPVRILHDSSKSLGFDESSSQDQRFINVTLVGYGNLQMCLKLMKLMIMRVKFERYKCNDQDPCQPTLLETPFLPWPLFQYLGTGEYYYSSQALGTSSHQFKPLEAINKATQFCATSYDRLLELYPSSNERDSHRALKGCFKISWVVCLLHFGLKMPLKPTIDFKIANQIDSNPLDWTYGALLAKLWN